MQPYLATSYRKKSWNHQLKLPLSNYVTFYFELNERSRTVRNGKRFELLAGLHCREGSSILNTYICLTFCAVFTCVTRYADTSIPLTGKTGLADRITRAWLLYASVLYKEVKKDNSRLIYAITRRGGKGKEVHWHSHSEDGWMKQRERFKMIINCWQYFQETLTLHAFLTIK